MESVDRGDLRRALVGRLTESELRDLAFDAGVDYETLPGTNKNDRARGLVAYFENRHRIDKLIRTLEDLRPDIRIRETPFDPGADLQWISTYDATQETGCGSTYLLKLAAEGRVDVRQEGDTWVFDREILLAYLHGWIGTEEASEVTDYTVQHIRWLAREGIVRAEKVRGTWLVHKESLLDYCRSRGKI
jgi:hypothetical protein